ncbi:hypothetical protein N7466_001382 [Penicillium verhagenii]|uniref:uncharacterized protein n=1 Tax=Penicillium verhagenii TaxID=1562060 RepID=UPI002545AAC2|nr:uncharacterized protein N7466_001382 [Penicillium verhagenii]KAJ5948367.1 hypothetical protein N7466_001382 [Penicillium verhagenii]
MWKLNGLYIFLACATSCHSAFFKPQNDFQELSGLNVTFPIDLPFNNRAFGLSPGDADFDGASNSYPATQIPPERFSYGGFNYQFANYNATGGYDNVLTQGQEIKVPQSKYFSYQMLAASESGMASGKVLAKYADGSTTSGSLLVPAWWSWPYPEGGDLIFTCYLTENGTNWNRSNIFQTTNWLDSSKELVSLTFPNASTGSSTSPGGAAISTKLHIFALSMLPLSSDTAGMVQLETQYARSTKKWIEGTDKVQIVEVLVNNVGSSAALRNNNVRVRVESPGLETVNEGIVNRLGPGDQAIVEVGVRNRHEVNVGDSGPAHIVIQGQNVMSTRYAFQATYGIGLYEATYESVYTHESPNWYNNAKYGIFIHWGIYSVPGWGNSGTKEDYAEWYWWWLNEGPSGSVGVYNYHLDKYGPNVVYDDFVQNFTASEWDPKGWVDLFADAGANYIIQELFDAAKKYQPHLHRATLPEWFNPDYKEYGFGDWPGAEWASEWFNKAATENRQVVMNARCGLPGDFDTPEYATYSAVQRRKWESNLGMDPYSYGYNRATPLASYMNASTIVTSLVDIVSKNGNFLLDVGPTANGTILDIEQLHLRQAGKWIKTHEEAIFNTTYWFVTPEEGDVRFTISQEAFYIHTITKPNNTLSLSSPVPWVEGDQVTVVGGNMHGTVVPSHKSSDGSLVISVSKEVAAADQYAWVFKIPY